MPCSDGQVQATSAVSPVSPVTQISDGVCIYSNPSSMFLSTAETQLAAIDTDAAVFNATYPLTLSQQIEAPTGTAAPSGYMPSNSTMPYLPVQTGNGASALQLSSGLGLFAAIFGVAML